MAPPGYPDNILSQRHIEAIGRIIINWADVETFFGHILGFLITGAIAPDNGMAMIAIQRMNVRAVTGLIKSLYRLSWPDDADQFDKMVDSLVRDGKRRDIIAHAYWRKGNRPNSVSTWAAQPANVFRLQMYDYRGRELRALADRIQEKQIALIRFVQARGMFPRRPSPGKSP